MNIKSIDKKYVQYIVAFIISIVGVIIISLYTNSLDINKYSENFADFKYFMDMAENGIIGNTHLLAPFAYRFITPLFARIISQTFAASIVTGFKIIAYIGVISQLFLVFVLAKYFRSNFWHGMVTMAVVALQCKISSFQRLLARPLSLSFDDYRHSGSL